MKIKVKLYIILKKYIIGKVFENYTTLLNRRIL